MQIQNVPLCTAVEVYVWKSFVEIGQFAKVLGGKPTSVLRTSLTSHCIAHNSSVWQSISLQIDRYVVARRGEDQQN